MTPYLEQPRWSCPSTTAPQPFDLTAFGTGAFFITNDANNVDDLWHINSAGQAVKLTSPTKGEIQPDGTLRSIAFTPLGSNLIFSGQDSVHGQGLFSTNGTTVTFLAQVNAASDFSVIGSKLYFQGSDAANGAELWISDGTSVGTHRVTDTEAAISANISDFVTFGSKIYFSANDGVHGQELWTFNGNQAGASMVGDLNPGAGSSNPNDLTVMGSALYFAAADASGTAELWRTDGTSGGTHAITTATNGAHAQKICSGSARSSSSSGPTPSMAPVSSSPTGPAAARPSSRHLRLSPI